MVRCLGLGLDFDGINYIMGSQLGKLCINVAQYTGVFWKILCRYFGERHINDAKLPCVDMLSRNPCFPLGEDTWLGNHHKEAKTQNLCLGEVNILDLRNKTE